MCLVVAVTMQQSQIVTLIVVMLPILMVHLNRVSRPEVESTMSTFAVLLSKKKGFKRTEPRIIPEFGTPISPIAIVGRTVAFHLDVLIEAVLSMKLELDSILRLELPSPTLVD